MRKQWFTNPVYLTLIYGALSAVWILFSDRLSEALFPDARELTSFQTFKGLLFVSLSTLVFYVFARAAARGKDIEYERDAILTQFAYLYQHANDVVLLMDDDGRFLQMNGAAFRVYGYDEGRFRQMRASDLRAEAAKAEFAGDWQKLPAKSEGHRYETLHRKADGTIFPVEVSGHRFVLNGRGYRHYVIRDITERKQFENDLRTARDFYFRLFEEFPNMVWRENENGENVYVNSTFTKFTGLSQDQTAGNGWAAAIHPDDRANHENICRDARRQCVPFRISYRLKHQSGTYRWVSDFGKPYHERDGSFGGYIGSIVDIQDIKDFEAQVARMNDLYQTLSGVNQTIVRAKSRKDLCEQVCRVAVEEGKFKFAVIGIAEAETGITRPEAWFGETPELAAFAGSLTVPYRSDLPVGTSLPDRTLSSAGEVVSNDVETDAVAVPFREDFLRRDIRSAGAFPLIVEGRFAGWFALFSGEKNFFTAERLRLVSEITGDLSFAIETLGHEAERLQSAGIQRKTLIQTIEMLGLTIEKRDPYTAGHQRRVAELSVAIAAELGRDDGFIEGLRLGALIHDIGKIYIPSEILSRPGRLTVPEYELVKTHVQVGHDIIRGIEFPWPVADMIVQHHERLDGSGYPHGLKGDEIIPEARIIGVADVVEAIMSHRPYRPGQGLRSALGELESHRGTRYDADVVDACLRLFREKQFQLPEAG